MRVTGCVLAVMRLTVFVIPMEMGIQESPFADGFVWVPTSVGTTVKAEGIYFCCCNICLREGNFQ